VPVVVVKPDEKRVKKRLKRALTRNQYGQILKDSGREDHETGENSPIDEIFEISNPQDVEARAVAIAIGIKAPVVSSAVSIATTASASDSGPPSPASQPDSPEIKIAGAEPAEMGRVGVARDDSSDEETYEEASDRDHQNALEKQLATEEKQQRQNLEVEKQKLHDMERSEAAAEAAAWKLEMQKQHRRAAGELVEGDEEDEANPVDDGVETPKPGYQDGIGSPGKEDAGDPDASSISREPPIRKDTGSSAGTVTPGNSRLSIETTKPARKAEAVVSDSIDEGADGVERADENTKV